MPAMAGRSATASRPATRATALLIPEAIPARLAGTAPNTAVVSGATTHDSPRPNTTTGTSTSGTYVEPGPIRWASAPARADSSSMTTVVGNSAAPAASGE